MKLLRKELIPIVTLVILITIIGCKKNDETPPTIQFTEAQDTTVLLQTLFEDPGVFVEDNKDLTAEIEVESDFYDQLSFNTDNTLRLTGNYEITYTATDLSGNEAEAIRNVSVINVSSAIAGSYDVTAVYENVPNKNFTSSISADSRRSGKVKFTKSYMHTSNESEISLNFEAWLYSNEHSLDITNSSVEPNEYFGWMATPDNPNEPFFLNMYAETALNLMPRYTYLHIPTQTITGLESDATYQIKGRNNDDTELPLSRITYVGEQLTEIVINATVTYNETPDRITETYVPR